MLAVPSQLKKKKDLFLKIGRRYWRILIAHERVLLVRGEVAAFRRSFADTPKRRHETGWCRSCGQLDFRAPAPVFRGELALFDLELLDGVNRRIHRGSVPYVERVVAPSTE